jgi:hypothetical protein
MFEVQSKEMNNIVNLIIRINGIGEGMARLWQLNGLAKIDRIHEGMVGLLAAT